MGPLAILAPVWEFFLLQVPERTVAGYTPEQLRRVTELRAAGRERLTAGRRARPQLAACLLLREAVVTFARARSVARDPDIDDATLALIDGSLDVPALSPDVLDGSTGDADRVREALTTRDPLYIDRLDLGGRERLRKALDRAATALCRGVEARSLTHLRAQRWGRVAAVVLLVLYAGWLGIRHRVMPVNIALGKPVRVSSYKQNPPDGHELVDGRPGFTFAVETNVEESPSVVIDLLSEHAIERIVIHNRADGWWDDCLPLVVELSRDDRTYTELARRDTHFGFDTPWVVQASGRMARFVRIRVARRSYLALGRVEIFGDPP
ncbi:MAG TPA: discoidin domain-containing protein [Polyangiaceae bacterium]